MGTTPTYGFPYPEGTDPLTEGAAAIEALAAAIEAKLASPVVHAHVYRAATQSIGSSAMTQINWDTLSYQSGFAWNIGNASQLVVPAGADGLYLVHLRVLFAQSGSATMRQVEIRKSGAAVCNVGPVAADATRDTALEATWVGNAAAGNYFQGAAWQSSGSALNVQAAPAGLYSGAYLTAVRLGRAA